MDSFTFKGVSSTEFNNLFVVSLPPITKPELKVEEIEIEGRDGVQYTDLGYTAYEKTFNIICLGTVDIEAIKNWLNGEGRLIFSNENDKYYNAKIIKNIDFQRLVLYEP